MTTLPKMQLTSDNQIESFFHCRQCIEKMPEGVSPEEWSHLEVGFTPLGIQVWCIRHGCNVVSIDFEGHRHPAITTCKKAEIPWQQPSTK